MSRFTYIPLELTQAERDVLHPIGLDMLRAQDPALGNIPGQDYFTSQPGRNGSTSSALPTLDLDYILSKNTISADKWDRRNRFSYHDYMRLNDFEKLQLFRLHSIYDSARQVHMNNSGLLAADAGIAPEFYAGDSRKILRLQEKETLAHRLFAISILQYYNDHWDRTDGKVTDKVIDLFKREFHITELDQAQLNNYTDLYKRMMALTHWHSEADADQFKEDARHLLLDLLKYELSDRAAPLDALTPQISSDATNLFDTIIERSITNPSERLKAVELTLQFISMRSQLRKQLISLSPLALPASMIDLKNQLLTSALPTNSMEAEAAIESMQQWIESTRKYDSAADALIRHRDNEATTQETFHTSIRLDLDHIEKLEDLDEVTNIISEHLGAYNKLANINISTPPLELPTQIIELIRNFLANKQTSIAMMHENTEHMNQLTNACIDYLQAIKDVKKIIEADMPPGIRKNEEIAPSNAISFNRTSLIEKTKRLNQIVKYSTALKKLKSAVNSEGYAIQLPTHIETQKNEHLHKPYPNTINPSSASEEMTKLAEAISRYQAVIRRLQNINPAPISMNIAHLTLGEKVHITDVISLNNESQDLELKADYGEAYQALHQSSQLNPRGTNDELKTHAQHVLHAADIAAQDSNTQKTTQQLTTLMRSATCVIKKPTPINIAQYQEAIKPIKKYKASSKMRIVAGAALILLGIACFAVCAASVVVTCGATAPLAIAGIKLAGTSIAVDVGLAGIASTSASGLLLKSSSLQTGLFRKCRKLKQSAERHQTDTRSAPTRSQEEAEQRVSRRIRRQSFTLRPPENQTAIGEQETHRRALRSRSFSQ